MTAELTLEQTGQASGRVTWRSVAMLAALAAVPGLAYLATVLLPFYASDLDELPLTELAGGAHDPTSFSPWLHRLGFFSLLLAPLGALLALGGCVVQLLAAFPRAAHRVPPAVAAGLGLVAVACVAVLFYFLSPLGQALTTWQLD